MMLITKQKLNNKTGKSTYEVKVKVNLDDAKIVMVGDSEGT